ncbi:MAG: LPS export ABC transporter permease LptF [Rhodospirillales bacterium]|nr:LPS export ABC transporter permease LptF [Alphaproteobacteria bacterium]MCB1840608.1 LPS export ABC transporter permease LptF [Alphaproteobacteria bacterium]MCB9977236.1 LPS export ABC transporter permease LptF [Rhodospirillales bacterium]
MKIFERYIFRNLAIGTVFVALTLTFIIFLTQSLRFLEMILESNTSGSSLWILTLLALPRFFEIILPLSLMTATLFIYNKMTLDSELVVIRAIGHSPFTLAKPALLLGMMITVFLWINALWIAPASLNRMQQMRLSLTTEFSNYLFREGVFNQVGKGLTVYIHKKSSLGDLAGLMIYDTRDKNKSPSTILAKRGQIVATDEGQQVLVFDGSRQEFDLNTSILQRLDFEKYTIDIPSNTETRTRWQEPDERTITELLNPDPDNDRDVKSADEFLIEIHRRITAPLMALAVTLIAVNCLLLGEVERRGQTRRIILAVTLVVLLQSFSLGIDSMTRNSLSGIPLRYLVTLGPVILGMVMLSSKGEEWRRKLLNPARNQVKGALA